MSTLHSVFEEIRVLSNELGAKVKELIHEGNVRRIIIKDEHGNTFMEIPISVAAVSVIFAPVLAAVAAIAAMASKFTVVEEKDPGHSAPEDGKAADSSAASSSDTAPSDPPSSEPPLIG